MKKLFIILGVVVVVAVVAVIILIGSLDKIVKNVIESSGSELMGVPVTVSGVKIKLTSGSGEITGLKIANPPGYKEKDAFRMDMIRVAIAITSLSSSPIVINDLTIDSPIVNLEVKENKQSNLQELMDNINRNSDKADQKAAEEQPKTESGAPAEPILLAFKKLSIKGVTVNIIKESSGDKVQSLTLPAIELTDVGGNEGVTPGKLGGIIFGAIIKNTLESFLKDAAAAQVEKAGEGLMKKLDSKLQKELK